MNDTSLSAALVEKLRSVTGRRSKIVVEHILQYGFVTTEDLEQTYGYKHSPRAVKDVRDQGIPIETYSVKSSDGRTIAAYRFADLSTIRLGRIGGRSAFSKRFKQALYAHCGGRCAICNGSFALRELQIDHRIPYEIAGDTEHSEEDVSAYMLLCGSCNRAKSWTCENSPNWQVKLGECGDCYWAYPAQYSHIAMKQIRRTDIIWEGTSEVTLYDQVHTSATQSAQAIPEHIKNLLKNILL